MNLNDSLQWLVSEKRGLRYLIDIFEIFLIYRVDPYRKLRLRKDSCGTVCLLFEKLACLYRYSI